MNRPTYLITGATGFVGRHLLETLVAHVPDVRLLALVRDPAAWDAMEWTRDLPAVETIVGTVTDPDGWRFDPRLKDLSGVFHMAALVRHTREDSGEVYRTNVAGTLHMVRLAAELGCRLVHMSTSGTVGCFERAEDTADEHAPYCEDVVRNWPYYHSKIEAERQARRLAEELGADLVIIRPPVLLGPGDHRFRSTGHIIKAMMRRLPFLISGGIHFIDIRDASMALVNAMGCESPRPVYHLSGTACSIGDFFRMVEEISGVPKPAMELPYRPAWLLARATRRLGWLPDPVVIEMASKYWNVDSRYAMEDLGYRSRDAYDTLTDTVDWLRENHVELMELKAAA